MATMVEATTRGQSHAAAAPGFPHGALFTVHDDRAVAAFDLGGIARALGLGEACLR